MSAIAQAERSGLRGGWVMNLDTSAGNANRRAHRDSTDSEMVDIDLEGGKGEKFGSPKMNQMEFEQQREEERLAMAGLEHRRSPVLGHSRTPSPLSREASFEGVHSGNFPEQTPRAHPRQPLSPVPSVPPSVMVASNSIRRPPPVANHSDVSIRTFSPEDEKDREVVRGGRATTPRMERESSVVSTDSQDGLLGTRSASPVPVFTGNERVASPTPSHGSFGLAGRNKGLEEEMEEVSLDATR